MPNVFWAAFGGGVAGGAVAALAAVIVEWVRYLLIRPRLKISGASGYRVTPGLPEESATRIGLPSDKELQLFLSASNDRQHPITVTGFGLRLKGRKAPGLFVTPNTGWTMPYEILPGRNLVQTTSIPWLVDELRKMRRKPNDLKCVWFSTVIGREF